MSEQIASPPAGGQGAPPVSPPAAPPVENNASPPAAPPPPPDQAKPYYADWKNPEMRGYAERKGWKDPEAITESFFNLEKFHGVPADQLLKLPPAEKMADPEVMKPILERLGYGAPKEASEYGFAEVEGVAKERAGMLADLALKHNVPKATATAFFQELATLEKAQLEADEAQYVEAVALERGKLKAEVGAAKWDEYEEHCKRTARQFGLDEEAINQIEANIGYTKTMKFLNAVGQRTGEAQFVDGGPRKSDGMTPEAAYSEIQALRSDTEFGKRLLAGDQAARAKWDRLNQIASLRGAQQ